MVERKYCTKCKSTENLHKYSKYVNKEGTVFQYYMCGDCGSARHKAYYHAGNQKKFVAANRRYRIRRDMGLLD